MIESKNRLKQLATASLAFEARHGYLPPAGADAQGNTANLSWRVYLFDVMANGQSSQFHFDEPWDSPHNETLIDQMPPGLKAPGVDLPPGYTVYVAVTGPGTVYQGPRPGATSPMDLGPRLVDVRDPAGNIMIVEVDPEHAVIWTKPDDLVIDPGDLRKGLGNVRTGGFNAAKFDSSVDFVPLSTDGAVLRELFRSEK
jgi:hypothetical protein